MVLVDSFFRFASKLLSRRVLSAAAIALSVSACVAADGSDPVDAARNDASSDFGCSDTSLAAHVEWQDSSCDADGNCTDDVWVDVAGCGRSGVYDCTSCLGGYTCSRSD